MPGTTANASRSPATSSRRRKGQISGARVESGTTTTESRRSFCTVFETTMPGLVFPNGRELGASTDPGSVGRELRRSTADPRAVGGEACLRGDRAGEHTDQEGNKRTSHGVGDDPCQRRGSTGPASLVHTTSAHRRVTAVCALLAPHPKDLSCRSLTAMRTLARKWRNWQTRRIQDPVG